MATRGVLCGFLISGVRYEENGANENEDSLDGERENKVMPAEWLEYAAERREEGTADRK